MSIRWRGSESVNGYYLDWMQIEQVVITAKCCLQVEFSCAIYNFKHCFTPNQESICLKEKTSVVKVRYGAFIFD